MPEFPSIDLCNYQKIVKFWSFSWYLFDILWLSPWTLIYKLREGRKCFDFCVNDQSKQKQDNNHSKPICGCNDEAHNNKLFWINVLLSQNNTRTQDTGTKQDKVMMGLNKIYGCVSLFQDEIFIVWCFSVLWSATFIYLF